MEIWRIPVTSQLLSTVGFLIVVTLFMKTSQSKGFHYNTQSTWKVDLEWKILTCILTEKKTHPVKVIFLHIMKAVSWFLCVKANMFIYLIMHTYILPCRLPYIYLYVRLYADTHTDTHTHTYTHRVTYIHTHLPTGWLCDVICIYI